MLIRYVHRYFTLIDIKKYIPVYINGRFQTFFRESLKFPNFDISMDPSGSSRKYALQSNCGPPTDCVGGGILKSSLPRYYFFNFFVYIFAYIFRRRPKFWLQSVFSIIENSMNQIKFENFILSRNKI